MKTVTVNNFAYGIADDIYSANVGEFSIAKHFDVLSYPHRLKPLRGVTTDTINTGIGNIIVASDGLMYGVGLDIPGNPTLGKLWQRSGYGASDGWQAIPTNTQLSGTVLRGTVASPQDYSFLVEYKDALNTKQIFWASTNLLLASDKAGASGISTQALTFTNIGQGFVHPQYKILYVPYDNFVGSIGPDVTPFNTHNFTALTLPLQYQIPCLCDYGNYLAVPAFSSTGISVSGSEVFFWDTTSPSWNEQIKWGAGQLRVLNNLNGELVGVSTASVGTAGGNVNQDSNSILIKVYSGGTEAVLVKEIIAQHSASANAPTVTINPNVNFIHRNRLYFSVNINPNDGISNSYYGLWSIGKNKVNGRWTVNMERIATNDNSETGVIACAISGDFVSYCHTAFGTLTFTINGQTSSATYGATSVYESVINPNMTLGDKPLNKKLISFLISTVPLTTGQQVVAKYRVDSKSSADWITIFTKTSTSPDTKLVFYNSPKPASGQFRDGNNYEFRIESTGGAEVTSFTYTYNTLTT